jgi:hypothetical protein
MFGENYELKTARKKLGAQNVWKILISKAQFANFPVWLLRNSQNNNNTNV